MPKVVHSTKKEKRGEKLKTKFATSKKFHQKSKSSTNPDRKIPEKSQGPFSNFRSKSTIKRLNMYNEKPDM
jgi:hypothetical protein